MSALSASMIIRYLQQAGLTLPKEAQEPVASIAAVDAARAAFKPLAGWADRPITSDNAADVLEELALRHAQKVYLDPARGELVIELERRIRAVLRAHVDELLAELGTTFNADVYVNAAKLINHADSEADVFAKGGEATASYHALHAADQRFNSVVAMVRAELGSLTDEPVGDRLSFYLKDDDGIDDDELAVLRSQLRDASIPVVIAERGHRPGINTTAQSAELIRNAARRQQHKQAHNERVLVATPRDDGLVPLSRPEWVKTGQATGNDGGVITWRGGPGAGQRW